MMRNNHKLLLFLLIRTESCDHGFMQAFARGYINSNFTVKEEEKKHFPEEFLLFSQILPNKNNANASCPVQICQIRVLYYSSKQPNFRPNICDSNAIQLLSPICELI